MRKSGVKVRLGGVRVGGTKVTGAEVFEDEVKKSRKSKKVRKSTGLKSSKRSQREACPSWVISDTFGPQWPFNFTISQVRRWWRLGIVSEELKLMQCTSCGKSFTIMREYHNGNVSCPYCKASASSVPDQESYLNAMCKHILERDKREYVEEGST